MADIQISGLTTNPSPQLTDMFAIDNAGSVSYKQTAQQTLTLFSNSLLTALTGDVTASPAGGSASTSTIAANAVTYTKFQQVAPSSLVGNATGSLANAAGITLGSSLTFSGSSINTIQNITISSSVTFAQVSAGQFNVSGSGSGVISILPQATAGTYNFNLPIIAGTSGFLLTSGGGVGSPMTWTDPATIGGVTSISATSPLHASTPTGAVALTIDAATVSTLGVASFNTTHFSVTAGAVSANNFTITAGTGLTGGGSLTLGGSTTVSLSTPVSVANGGSGQSSYIDGQLLIGNTATTGLSKATLTQGSGITITNGNGTITIATSAVGGVSSVTATSPLNAIPNTGAVALTINNATTSSVGAASFNSTNFTVTTGAVNTIQDITTTSNLRFGSLTLNGAANASALLTLTSTTQGFLTSSMTATQMNAISSPAAGLFIFNNTAADLYFYTGSTWISVGSSSGVTSITGTANQITASANTGAITLSFPSTVEINGSISANVQFQVTQNQGYGTYLTGTCANTAGSSWQAGIFNNVTYSPTSGSARTIGMWSSPIVAAPTSQTIGYASCFTASMSSAGNLGTISNYYGFFYDGTFTVNSITNMYGAYFTSPPTGTTTANQALYTDNISVGYPTLNLHGKNNIVVSGRAIFGRSNDDGSNTVQIAGNTISLGTIATSGLITGSPFTYSTFTNTNYIMISSDTSGDVVWGALSSILSGTANQISVSGSGSTTLALTNGISIGSYQATSSPAGGIICPGNVGIATSSATNLLTLGTINTAVGEAIKVNGNNTQNYMSFYNNATRQGYIGTNTAGSGFIVNSDTSGGLTLQATGGNVINLATTGNVGVFDTAPGSKLSVVGNCQVGFSSGTTAPSNGLVVNGQAVFGGSSAATGQVTIGSSTVDGRLDFYVATLSAGRHHLQTFLDSSSNSTLQITASGGGAYTSFYQGSTLIGYFGTGNSGTIPNLSIGTPLATITNNALDVVGSTSFGTYAGVNTAPSNGLIVSGRVGFGTAAPLSTTVLDIQGTGAIFSRIYGTGTGSFAGGQLLLANDCTTVAQGGTFLSHQLNSSNPAQSFFTIQQRTNDGVTFEQEWLHFNYYNNTGYLNAGLFGFLDTNPATVVSIVGNCQIGFASNTTAPSSGLVVSGRSGFGTSVGDTNSKVNISTSLANHLLLNGTQTSVDGGSGQIGLSSITTFQPTSGSNNSYGVYSGPVFIAPSGQTIASAASIVCGGNLSLNVGNITRYYGFYFSGTGAGAGAINTAYGMYLTQPTCALNNYAASIQGGLVLKYVGKSVSYAATTADYYIGYTSTSSPFTVTLPASAVAGWTCTVKDESGGAGTNNITLDGNGNNIDGAPTAIIASNYGSITVYYNGANYFTI